ncbi:unnamed protein product [Pleuronectes platessa]|uniref:Uncharacterized protein n=1 Tax=Pleuronectes platessa TaxID=8262 RepID=A0A9N7V1L1_PLEPL|nr:unnamed protein product [Pleuronectes platessa]
MAVGMGGGVKGVGAVKVFSRPRELQLSYHTAQGSGTEAGFTAAGGVHTKSSPFSFCGLAAEHTCFGAWKVERSPTVWLPECGAPQSRLMMCERRAGGDKSGHSSACRRELTFDAHSNGRTAGECLLTGRRGAYHPLPQTIAIRRHTLLG